MNKKVQKFENDDITLIDHGIVIESMTQSIFIVFQVKLLKRENVEKLF